MTPDRADIILAGLSIVDALMKRFRVNTLVIHTRGVRDGLVREMIDDAMGTTVDDPAHRDAAIERLAAACSGELEHGRTVALLAGRLYQQLATTLELASGDRLLLECAARLQDVGYVINYDQHHKHSYHLIRNSRLPGIRAHDLEVIANVARYHRGAHPKRKHENLARLSSEDQSRVQRMAAILRLAGGLDRSRSQQVRDVRVRSELDGVFIDVVARFLRGCAANQVQQAPQQCEHALLSTRERGPQRVLRWQRPQRQRMHLRQWQLWIHQ
jgi:exopolyphosphatase/guanosine-5'-triphosphate,3'-diphosphate pyrophosphatase